ncbi:MOSC and FAD-binding oxidoreductase domain-containing protein [Methylocapsa sp. D3K7]|uniref:MOSC and FAD-binding oxidoreductase domain-containing protein n=1 Tax=Methylocapsa sp. D3K7 TaxID=3041435 RepID=UPI00244EA2E3|nr:MOSC and FAD-binding oxidoreductase domain-containing protein [Methylocapsa sp. D3K7]WGJ16525.1 MOSC and FAD-binding oxidoreductase domain-containing protein [Methylocapsa sp. D3K7]
MARLLSVNVGLPRDIEWQGKTVHTAVWKTPVQGRRMTRRLNIDGDGQGDLAGHGGEHRAVFVYQIESYRYWQNQLGRNDFTYGQFGENFTVEGLADTEVCIGDHYRIGDALFEVTQPRVTCYRVGIRMNEPQMAALLVSHGRPGFYFRVLGEGEVGAGDDIVKVKAGPERVVVAEINALLYLPGHPASGLERALRIPALSAGWRTSLEALLDRERKVNGITGNPGLGPPTSPPPAWRGFRSLRVSRKLHESSNVTSLVLEPADGEPLMAALAGQFIVLRLRPRPDGSALLRSYSLSGAPSEDRYRISVKREPHGAAGAYIDTRALAGDILDVSAPRGSFTLRQGERPVVLASAGIGATPVLAMLHVLAAEQTRREIWWIHGARNSSEHPFAAEVRELLKALPGSRSHIRYSAPKPTDRPTVDFDRVGRVGVDGFEEMGVPPDADFYICGPAAFMSGLVDGLAGWGVARDRLHTENFGSGQSMTPGIATVPRRPPHLPGEATGGPLVSFTRSNLAVHWGSAFHSLLELAEACDVPVRWSCRTGVCHTCETGLISGSVVYRPDPVEPPVEGNLLICCSQPQGDIALDL